MDVSARSRPSRWPAGPPSSVGDSDGFGESDVGLHADSGCFKECGPPRWPLDDRPHPARRRHSAKSAAPHDLAYVHPGALAGTRRCRLLHQRSMDRPRLGDVFRRVPARCTVTARPRDRVHAVPGRGVRHSMSTAGHSRNGTAVRRTDSALRSRSKVEQRRRAVQRPRLLSPDCNLL